MVWMRRLVESRGKTSPNPTPEMVITTMKSESSQLQPWAR